MDPVTLIVSAVAAGAVAAGKEVAGQAVKDAYGGVKALILRRFESRPDVAVALGQVEKKPDSEPRMTLLREELETAGAGEDAEVVKQALALMDFLRKHGLAPGPSSHAEVHGSGAVAQGDGAVAGGAGGVAIGGNVVGDVRVGARTGRGDRDPE